MDLQRLNQINEDNAQKEQDLKKRHETLSANIDLQETIVKSFKALVDFLEGNTSKTLVVNQLKEIGTPDVKKVVDAVTSLHETQKTHENVDLTEITSVMNNVLDEAKKIPKDHAKQDKQKFVDYSSQLKSMEKAVKTVETAVKAQKIRVEAPIVNVDAPIVEVDAPDIKPLGDKLAKDLKKSFNDAVKKIVIPEQADTKELEKLAKKTNKLLNEMLESPMGGGSSGGSPVYATDSDNHLQVDVLSGGGGGTQYTEGDTDATITGTAVMWEDATDTLRAVSSAKPMPVDIEALSGTVSTVNSTSTPLGIGGVFTGTSEDVIRFSSITIAAFADEASATGGLDIQFSPDGTNWDHTDSHTVVANTSAAISLAAQAQYFRIVYTNGSTAQTVFRLQVILSPIGVGAITEEIGGDISDTTLVQTTRSVLSAKKPNGDYVNIESTAGGNLKVSMQEISDGLDIGAGNAGAETQRVSISTDDVNLASINTDASTIAGAVHVEDSGHTTGDTGTMSLAVRNDNDVALAGTDLDYIPLSTDASGHLLTHDDADAVIDSVVGGTDSGTAFLAKHQEDQVHLTTADGDYDIASLDSLGSLHVNAEAHHVFDSMNATTGWTALSNDTLNLATTKKHVSGTDALTFDKVNGAANTIFAGIQKTLTSVDLGTVSLHDLFQGAFYIPDLSDVAYTFLRIGTDSSNYAEWQLPVDVLTAGVFETAALTVGDADHDALTGNGMDSSAITYIAVGVAFNAETDTLAGIIFDEVSYHTNQHSAASINSEVTSAINSSNINLLKVGNKVVNTQAGNVSTGTQRVTIATDDANLASINTDAGTIAGAVSGTEMQVDVVTSALPTGAATAANQQTDALTDTELRATPVVVDLGANNDVTVSGTVTVDGSGVTQPVSGTVTANLGATDNAVLDSIDLETQLVNAYAMKTAVDSGDSTITYQGWAVPGTLGTGTVWRIRRITDDGAGTVDIEWEDGNANFDNQWSTREAGSYS